MNEKSRQNLDFSFAWITVHGLPLKGDGKAISPSGEPYNYSLVIFHFMANPCSDRRTVNPVYYRGAVQFDILI
jgi:hypothetical protein